LQNHTLPVISKDCFTYLFPNRQIIVGFFIKLSDSVLKSTESLNKSKGAVMTHINASSDAIELTLVALQKAGVCSHAITTWYDKDEDDQTWDLFQVHFTKQDKERLRRLTAQATGYHGANKAAAPITPMPVPTTNQIATAAAPQVTQYSSNNISLFYCWTHGLSQNPEHTSGSCKSKAEGHSNGATIDDRKGGVTKFNFGRSGKARRVNFQG
jgi:hypothetical protein